MLIAGIHHKVGAEIDARRTASFMRYLIHFLEMFAFLGFFIPIFIGVDYFCPPQTQNEIVNNKFYQVLDNLNQIEYHFYTDTHHFLSDAIFYENTNVGDQITFYQTPIFKTTTDVAHYTGPNVYTCNPHSIYNWPLIVIGLTFICSILVIIKTWGWMKKREHIKYDSVVNLGVINAFLCIITLVAILFHIPY